MRLFGFVLLVVGLLLCVSIVWAALGFLMMGFGLICLLIAERNRNKRAPKPDVPELAADAYVAPAPRPDKTVARRPPPVFLEPTFAAAPAEADLAARADVSDSSDLLAPEADWSLPVETVVAPVRSEHGVDRRSPPPPRATRTSEFDRIRALRADRAAVRSEPEFRDFVAPAAREPGRPPSPPPLPAQSASAEAAVPPSLAAAPPPVAVAPPITVEPKPAAKAPRPEIAPVQPAAPKADRSVLFDDTDDLADLFNKFDLGKD